MKAPEYCLIRAVPVTVTDDGQTINGKAQWVRGVVATWIAHLLWRHIDKGGNQ